MKTSTILIIVFAILAAIVVGVKSLEVQANNKAVFTPTNEIGTGKVRGIHNFTLKDGVEPQEFERFITEEWNPVMQELWPGAQNMFMKGERGPHVGQYIMVIEMNSLYVRNFYWPTGGASEAAKAIQENWGDAYTQVMNRGSELAERTEWTDYVEIVKK